MSNATQTTNSLTDPDQLQKLLERAQAGDASTLPVVKELLKNPAAVELFGGNLAHQAELSLINNAAGKDLMFKEALTRKLELLRADLEGPSPTPMERLLVECIVACWLQVQHADVLDAQTKDKSMQWATFYQHRMDRAHKRYLAAIKTLAIVRKLVVPVVQVNIAKKQVNMAGPVVG